MGRTVLIDVSALITVDYMTGIQRVVKEFTLRLHESDIPFELVAADAKRCVFSVLDRENYREKMAGKRGEWKKTRRLALEDIGKEYCFVDLDGVWNQTNVHLRRQNLYSRLKQQGAKVGTFIHDVIPIQYPQLCGEDSVFRFPMYLSAVLEYADFMIATTQTTRKRLLDLMARTHVQDRPIYVVPLGSDFKKPALGTDAVGEAVLDAVSRGQYLMMLGTLEPRKNHRYLLDAYDQGLRDLPVNLIIAGRVGWGSEELARRIRGHEALGSRLFFIEAPSDAEVNYLYDHAYAVVFPSIDEGFGIPVIEALYHGKPLFASDIGVLREVGGEYADYFDLRKPSALTALVKRYLADPQAYSQRAERIRGYQAPGWDESTQRLCSVLARESAR